MTTASAGKKEVLVQIENVLKDVHKTVLHLTAEEMNTVPYKDSWTAAQVLVHLSKSANDLGQAMLAPAELTSRDPGERIAKFRRIFLDFNTKINAPEFIIPEEGLHRKESVLRNLDQSYEAFNKATALTDLREEVKGLPLGDVTKLELLHFVLYHTQRHLHQLQKICDAVLQSKKRHL